MYIIDKINMLFGINLNNENLYFIRLDDGILTSIKLFFLNNNFIKRNKGILNSNNKIYSFSHSYLKNSKTLNHLIENQLLGNKLSIFCIF